MNATTRGGGGFCVNATLLAEMVFDGSDALVLSLLVVAFLVALVGNATMLLILVRNLCQKRRRVLTLLLHMNIADLLTTCVSLPKEIIWTATKAWYSWDVLCRACRMFDVLGVYLSANVLVCISLDRFMSILFPLYALRASRSIKRMLVTAWTVAIVSSLPQVFLFRVAAHPCFKWYTQCISKTFLGEISPHVDLFNTMLNAGEAYLIPFIVIVFCYSAIMVKISKEERGTAVNQQCPSNRQAETTGLRAMRTSFCNEEGTHCSTLQTTAKESTTRASVCFASKAEGHKASQVTTNSSSALLRRSGQNHLARAKHKTLRMTVVMVVAFLVCWTPYFLMATWHFLDIDYTTGKRRGHMPDSAEIRLAEKILNVFACFNSSINPYLYGYFTFDLKQELEMLLVWLTNGRLRLPVSAQRRRFSSTAVQHCDESMPLTQLTSRGPNKSAKRSAQEVRRKAVAKRLGSDGYLLTTLPNSDTQRDK